MSTKFYGGSIKKGSTGKDVDEWQKYLKNNGYSDLTASGTFDDATFDATKKWQGANGLTETGEVDDNTWGKAGYKNLYTPISPDLPEALSVPDLANFNYDFNADALYQQYKDKYIQQGQLAMADTMGQAAAMTGGYGNSYAATVGNQAYQAQMQNLNDIVPELYNLAYSKVENQYKNDLSKWAAENENAWKQAEWDERIRLNELSTLAASQPEIGFPKVPENIQQKLEQITGNHVLNSYLSDLVANNILSDTDAKKLYALYYDDNEVYTYDGEKITGYDWAKMIENAKGWHLVSADTFVAPNGEVVTYDDLFWILTQENGKSEDEATEMLENLQLRSIH